MQRNSHKISKRVRKPIWLALFFALLTALVIHSMNISAATPTGTRLKNIQSRVLIGTEFPSGFTTMSDSATFTSTAKAEFNLVTAENAMKWDATEPSQNNFNYAEGDKLVNWAQANGMKIHGHTFVWHNQTPSWVQGLNAGAMQSAMYNHIDKVMNHFKGKILVWDVVNEAFEENGSYRNSFWYRTLGKSFIENAFIRARAADPGVKLIYNDYNLEATGSKSNAAYNMLKDFKSRGIPVDGIGFQMHLDIQYGFDYNDFASNMQRFADLGLEIYITEMDVRVSSNPSAAELQTQADYYKGVIQKCMAQPAVKAIQVWGFTDKYSWVPGTFPGRGAALIFDSNYNPKPSYYAVQSALGSDTPTPTPGPRSAFSQIEAESYDTQSGIQTESCNEGGQNIGYVENGDYVVYNNIDFGSGATGFQARVASATSGGNIEIRLDSITGALVGTCPVAGTGDWQTWVTATCNVSGVSGTHNLYLSFTGGSGYLFNVNRFQFTGGSTPTPTPTPTLNNLISNPGMETGNTNGWAVNGAGSIAVSTAQKHSGTYSLLSTGRTSAWNGPIHNITSKVQSGTTYHCSGWVRLDNVASDAIIMTIKKVDGGGTTYTNIVTGTGSNSSWVQLSGSYTLTVTGTLNELSVYFEGPASGVNMYVDDVLVTTGDNATPTPPPANKFHCFLLLGQSNMAGYALAQAADKMEDPRVLVLGYDNNSTLGRVTDQWDVACPPLHAAWLDAIGPGDWFGKTVIQNVPAGDTIGLIPCAISGEKIETFMKVGGTKYSWIINRAKLAQQRGGVIEGILFHQGESNSGDTSWPGKVRTLVTDLRNDLNLGNVPFLAGELLYSGPCAGHNTLVNQLPSLITNCYVISANGLVQDPGDTTYHLHFSHDSSVEFGKRYAAKMIQVLGW